MTRTFFSTLQIPLRQGRDVTDADTGEAPPVALVSESFVRRYWPGQNPIGRRFGVAFAERTVVGVVADIRVRDWSGPASRRCTCRTSRCPTVGWSGTRPRIW